MHGDTAWSLIADLTREDADVYLRDRQARGFNTILVNLIEHRFATNAPANVHGEPPFLAEGDFAKPNPAYFDHAERILRRACDLGILVLLTPAYVGNGGGPEGWYASMAASGPGKLYAYGRFVGGRLGGLDNIVWVHGGDYDPPDMGLIRAVVDGIREADPGALHTAHGSPGSAALDHWAGEPWLALDNVYTYEPVHESAQREYRRSGLPFFLMESAYENEHDAGALRVRMQAYQAILSGATGHIYGNNPIWHFDGPGIYPVATSWREQLDSPGARSMRVLLDVVATTEWWRLEPDTENALLVGGTGGNSARALAARARDGSFALVYTPTNRPITLDLSRLAGPLVGASWRDPSSGEVNAIEGSPFTRELRTFLPSRRELFGDNDWILELRSQPNVAGRSEF
jgi:GNAT superfamily N-acetyltransferase